MSIDALSFDSFDDELLSRSVQGYAPTAPILPLPQVPTPSGHSTKSSIAPASKNFLVGLIGLHQETERLASIQAKNFDLSTQADLAEIEKMKVEKEAALENYAREMATRNTWSAFATVAQYLTSTASIVLGIACGTGTCPGALLIASGGLGIVNRLMNDTLGWEAVVSWFTKSEELQIKYARWIDTAALVVSLGLGLYGGILATYNGAFDAAFQAGKEGFTEKMGFIIGAGAAVMGAGSRLGQAFAEKRMAHIQARIREIRGDTTLGHQTLNEKASDVQRTFESIQAEQNVIRSGISASQLDLGG